MMRALKRLALALLAVAALCGPALAEGDPCQSEIARSWKMQRDEAIARLLKAWLDRAPAASLSLRLQDLVRAEVLMSACIPPLDIDDLYLPEVREKEVELIPLDILRPYARRSGLPLEAPRLFEGKTFMMERED